VAFNEAAARMKALSVGVALSFGAAGLVGAWWWSPVHAQQMPRHEPVKKAKIEQWEKELSFQCAEAPRSPVNPIATF
jgi:hypothetical protein